MSIKENVRKLTTSVVVLHTADANVDGLNLKATDLEGTIESPQIALASGTGPEGNSFMGLSITSFRDQVIVIIFPSRTEVRDESEAKPTREGFADTVHKVLSLIADRGVPGFRAFGLNFLIEFDIEGAQKKPAEVIADRLIGPKVQKSDYRLLGAGVKLYYQQTQRETVLYSLILEPRGGQWKGQPYYANLNVYQDIDDSHPMPDSAGLSKSLQEEYDNLIQFLEDTLTMERLSAKRRRRELLS